MIGINLCLNCGYKWTKESFDTKTVYVKGFFIIEDTIYRAKDFAQYISTLESQKIKDQVNKADGQFAIVICEDENVLAFVDHMRSFPIFYWQSESGYVISDDISLQMWQERNVDPSHKTMYLNTLYTFCETTLLSGVEQIPAGSYILIAEDEVLKGKYWRFTYSEVQIDDEKSACELLAGGYVHLFSLCKRLVQDKTVVIPLSGGYDSRLILNGVLKSGVPIEHIITFTYGDIHSEDARLSKEIADSIKVKHYFVDYFTNDAKKFFSSEFKLFARYASQASAIPCIQEWYAVSFLKNQGVIDENCIFMPGYGGVLPGHYIRDFFCSSADFSDRMEEELIDSFISLSPREKTSVRHDLARNILESEYFDDYKQNKTMRNLVQSYERFIYAEEQAKFIQNATRDYEYVGCEWISPFFFKEQFSMWSQIDNTLRLHNKVFFRCMEYYLMQELKEISFTGSKVHKLAVKKSKLCWLMQLFFFPKKNHVLFGLFPYHIYLKNVVRTIGAPLNYFVGCEVLHQLKDAKQKPKYNFPSRIAGSN